MENRSRRQLNISDRSCIFCGLPHAQGNPITGEHLWSDWMASILPQDPRAERVEFMEDLESELSMKPMKIETSKLGVANKKKIYVVCHSCNTGWMSGVETPSKAVLIPLMTGQQAVLEQTSIMQLAKFVMLKIMVAEHDAFRGRNTMPIYEPDVRKKFMDAPFIPDGVRMWIGPGGGPKWRTSMYRYVSGVRLTTAPLGAVVEPGFERRGANIQSVTWGLGAFFVQVIATTNHEFYAAHEWDVPNGLVPIWPPDGNAIVWPPNYAFTDWMIDIMAESLKAVSKTMHKVRSDGTLLPP